MTLRSPVAEQAAREQAEAEQLQQEIKQFEQDFSLGRWNRVQEYLNTIEDKDAANQVFSKILSELVKAMPNVDDSQAAQQKSQMQQRGETPPSSFLTPSDILRIADISPQPISIIETEKPDEPAGDQPSAAPADNAVVQQPSGSTAMQAVPVQRLITSGGITRSVTTMQMVPVRPSAATSATNSAASATTSNTGKQHLAKLAQLIRNARESGYDFSGFLKQLQTGTRHFGGQAHEKRLTAASLLMSAGMYEEAEPYLPKLDDENYQEDIDSLKLWAQQSRQRYAKDKVAKWLDRSWLVNQRILACDDATDSDENAALTRLIELSTAVEEEIGEKWLSDSFTSSPERGLAILANLGTQSAEMARKANQTSEQQRLKMLRLQNEAVNRLLDVSPDLAAQMQQTLTVLAQNWIAESNISVDNSVQTRRGGYMSIDMYGNYYWRDPNQGRTNSRQQPIKIGDVLELVPGATWQQNISSSLLLELKKVQAQLHLQINEEDQAFPFIEDIASEHPDVAQQLVHDFLKTWTQNHDPNTNRRQTNPYIYMYGFDQKAQSIPLTRSKQERNLEELAEWVARIRQMPIDDIDEDLLANAFTTCHSSAEVYELRKVKKVFGDLTKLKPETIAALAQKMRENLSEAWRSVKLQESKQTKRKLPEIQQEVLAGYRTAKALVDEALAAAPGNWQLQLALACIQFDANAYQQSVEKSSEFVDRRDAAFEQFALAAKQFHEIVAELEADEQSTEVFDRWFYAALGAVDLGKIDAKTVPAINEYAKIKAAIQSLPGPLAKDMMSKFANNLFTRMSPIKPELKFRYLKAGFEIVGEHPRAWEAKNLYEYYRDLVSEIQLDIELDGSAVVGTEPFGMYVNLKHTREIEREAGGFSKYVQNQNSMIYAYNYGRPTEDYRDKFRDGVDLALGEHFEVINVTFVGVEEMKSRPSDDGMRLTPYCYVLLKSKGPEVDRVPPLQLDLDFLDTSGYVVIPIESAALAIDSMNDAETRPIKDLKVTQTLDERQSAEGKLIVEVSATGKGLIPNIDEIINVEQDEFEVVEIDDQGSLPTTFDPEGNEIQILSDRSWSIEYRVREEAGTTKRFEFGDSLRNDADIKYQRYEDADLVAAEPVVQLETDFSGSGNRIWYWLGPVMALAVVGLGFAIWYSRPEQQQQQHAFEVPQDVNPFTVLSLLKDIRHRNGIDSRQRQSLDQTINRIESYYFGERKDETPGDLEETARDWVLKTR